MLSGIDASNASFLADLNRIENRITQENKRITSGIRVNQASDDPSAITAILDTQSGIDQLTQAQANLNRAKTVATSADAALQSASTLLDQLVSLASQGATSTATADSRAALAQQVQQIEQQLVSLANTNVQGFYVFGGDDTTAQPYTFDWSQPEGVVANPAAAVSSTGVLRDAAGNSIVPGMTAQQIFDARDSNGVPVAGNIFQAVHSLGVALENNDQAAIQNALNGLAPATLPLSTEIQGDGFFVVGNAPNQSFTRDGNFTVGSGGVLETQAGDAVQGWMSGANQSGPTSNIILPAIGSSQPLATTKFSIQANLDPSAANWSQTIQVVDSTGAAHTLTIDFTQTTPNSNTWSYNVSIPAADVSGGTPGSLASGTLTFNSNGTLDTSTPSPVNIAVTNLADGANDLSIDWNLFDPNGAGEITQHASSSALVSSTVDGSASAQVTQVGIQNGGQVVATFSNGQQIVEAQLALASTESTATIGLPDSGGRGGIISVGLATLKDAVAHLQQSNMSYGNLETWIDQANQDAAQRLIALQQTLTSLRDTDIPAAATQLTMDQTALDASLSAHASLNHRSLFSYLG